MPVFVKLEDPTEIRELIEKLKDAVGEARHLLESFRMLSQEEAHYFNEWKVKFGEMNTKVESVNSLMLEPEKY